MKSLEVQLNESLDEIDQMVSTIVTLKQAIHQERLLRAQVNLEERIAALPTASQERLRKAFPGTDLGGLKQAIMVERKNQ